MSYKVLYKPHKKWKMAHFKKTMPGIKNGIVRNKKFAEFLAKNITEVKNCETKIEKV